MWIIAAGANALVLLATLVLAIAIGIGLWAFRGVSPRYTVSLTTYGLALTPLLVLFWNTSVLILSEYHLGSGTYSPKMGDFDNPMIVYAAGHAIFHTLADMTSGWHDQLEIAHQAKMERQRKRKAISGS